MRIAREYKGTLLEITENGCSYLDTPDEHGRVPDDRRIQFMRGYLNALGRAMLFGANVRAYHHWSLLDNFEWAEGYAQRFGLTSWIFARRSAPSRTPATGTPNSLPPAASLRSLSGCSSKPSQSKARPIGMMKTMVAAIFLPVFASPLFAQDQQPAVSARGGCGPSDAYFDVKTDRQQHLVAPADPGKAIVYVFEDMERGPTMRVGLDGSWIGANKGKSYFSFSVDPGDHQVCTNWQSGTFKKRPSASVRP